MEFIGEEYLPITESSSGQYRLCSKKSVKGPIAALTCIVVILVHLILVSFIYNSSHKIINVPDINNDKPGIQSQATASLVAQTVQHQPQYPSKSWTLKTRFNGVHPKEWSLLSEIPESFSKAQQDAKKSAIVIPESDTLVQKSVEPEESAPEVQSLKPRVQVKKLITEVKEHVGQVQEQKSVPVARTNSVIGAQPVVPEVDTPKPGTEIQETESKSVVYVVQVPERLQETQSQSPKSIVQASKSLQKVESQVSKSLVETPVLQVSKSTVQSPKTEAKLPNVVSRTVESSKVRQTSQQNKIESKTSHTNQAKVLEKEERSEILADMTHMAEIMEEQYHIFRKELNWLEHEAAFLRDHDSLKSRNL